MPRPKPYSHGADPADPADLKSGWRPESELSLLTRAVHALNEQSRAFLMWLKSHMDTPTKQDLVAMENRMAIKLSEIKTAVATAAKANREAFTEIGTKIADLNKQIADLLAGIGDPEVSDEAFEAALKDLATDAKALADIVPGSPTTPPTPEG